MFYDTNKFNFIRHFQENLEIIRKEYLNLNPKILNVSRTVAREKLIPTFMSNNGWMAGWQGGTNEPNYDWLTYGLSINGLFPPEALEKFPTTMKILKSLVGIRVCAFSVMTPFSFIKPHCHPELGANLLTFHLGVDIPSEGSYLCVNGIFEEEKNNKAIVFDGSVQHFAINMGAAKRAIIYIEFDRSKIF